jgi:hypothetical protein
MGLDLFAGIPVSDTRRWRPWYERLLGGEPSFLPHATEAVWELADIASRGIEPDERVTYPGKARKTIYRDADGQRDLFRRPDRLRRILTRGRRRAAARCPRS